ncbi:MAG: peptide chain release factor 1 [Clostridia bacterium]|nr:peptide chain release factor 1 [Clostridia bacterium]
MLEKLREIEESYESLEASLGNPDLASDPKRYAALMKEYRRLTPVVEAYRAYSAAKEREKEAETLLSDSADPDFRALAAEEALSAKEEAASLLEKLKLLLLPKDPNDDKNVMLEIRAGAGGEEAALFCRDLYRMYSMYAANAGFTMSVLSKNQTELGGYKELILQVSGEGAYSRFKYESGVHRVQRVPETESQGRIQTSTVTVAVLPEAEEVSVEINPADLVFESCKSSGAGGQHINKTESAVRLTHKPTGIVVECQEERSQLQNKEKALTMLRTILYDRMQKEQNDRITSDRRRQVGTGDRSEKIRTYNYPQSRVTDHRIGLTLHSLDAFLNGDIGGMIDALATAENAEKLKESNQNS